MEHVHEIGADISRHGFTHNPLNVLEDALNETMK